MYKANWAGAHHLFYNYGSRRVCPSLLLFRGGGNTCLGGGGGVPIPLFPVILQLKINRNRTTPYKEVNREGFEFIIESVHFNKAVCWFLCVVYSMGLTDRQPPVRSSRGRWRGGPPPPPPAPPPGPGSDRSPPPSPSARGPAARSWIWKNPVKFWCGSGSDPDPRIHVSDLWIRILLFSSLTFKIPTKNEFKKKFFCL